MKCPFCQSEDLKVTDSRNALEVNAIRRRRECLSCLKRFTTFEIIELSTQVQKRDGRYEDFQQNKLIQGMEAACRHTKISRDQCIAIASEITSGIMQAQVNEVTTKEIGELVMGNLEKLDPIAYIRFACEYRRFNDIGEFIEAIKPIQFKPNLPPMKGSDSNSFPLEAENIIPSFSEPGMQAFKEKITSNTTAFIGDKSGFNSKKGEEVYNALEKN